MAPDASEILKSFVPAILKGGLELEMRIVEPRANGAFGSFENLGDVRMGHALDVEHRNHHSMGFRQLLHRFVQFNLKLVEVRLLLRIRLVGAVNERRILLDG